MASTQNRQKQTTKSAAGKKDSGKKDSGKKDSGKKKTGGRTVPLPEPYRPDMLARGIGAAVCLFLALVILLGIFGVRGIVPDLLCRGLKGLVGNGFWFAAPALIWAAGVLLLCRERGPALRLW